MKKKIIFFYVVLAAFSLTSFGFLDWNHSEIHQVETSVSDDLAIFTPVTGKINRKIFCDSNYAVGPNPWKSSHRILYLNVAPEKQAAYEGGMDALMEYLKENSKEARSGVENGKEARTITQMEELQPFKLVFTVTKNGTIENVKLDGTSGYLTINNKMIELITKAPGKWQAAENSKGEKVDQQLVVSFGLTGC